MPCHMDPDKYLCVSLVDVKLDCGHEARKPCHKNIETFPCSHPCEIRRPCGHTCTEFCHFKNDPDHLNMKCLKPCGRYRENCSIQEHTCPLLCHEDCPQCEIPIKKPRTLCKHVHEVSCCVDVDTIQCEKRCDKKMSCGHPCRIKCCEPCGNCKVLIEKTLTICGHKLTVKCCEEPNRKRCLKKCPLTLPCGHKCQNRCNQECTTNCTELIFTQFDSSCGHKFKIPCFKQELITQNFFKDDYNLLQHCQEPCGQLLDCEHICKGTCGVCVQGRIHQSCQEKCGATLICGHSCEIPCRETCQPCRKKCEYRCIHSKCGKKCGEPCSPCKEPCERRCKHLKCNKKCGEICTVRPCTEPCSKILKCGHPCLGFCGDICPPICRICKPDDEAFQLYFGNENEPDSKFVYLKDCNHSIEADALEYWMMQTNGDKFDVNNKKHSAINVKRCPRCNSPITTLQRYSHYIKKAYREVIEVKKKLYGSNKGNELKRQELNEKITLFITTNDILIKESKYLKAILNIIQNSLKPTHKGKRQSVNKIILSTYEAQLEIIEKFLNIFNKCQLKKEENIKKCIKHIDFLLLILSRQENRITQQEIQEFQQEILRFDKFGQMCVVEEDANFQTVFKINDEVKKLHTEIWTEINSSHKFKNEQDMYIKDKIQDLIKLVDENIILTEDEKRMIVKAMGMKQGHWFKCPNGHSYCIGECGGAMEVAKCPVCGEDIGGTKHNLLETNTHDGSMDGSTRPAWSNGGNFDMRNFLFND